MVVIGNVKFLDQSNNVLIDAEKATYNEIENIVSFINSQSPNSNKVDITEEKNLNENNTFNFMDTKNVDELYEQAVSIVVKQQKVSTSYIQRYLQIGYNRAARIIEKMEQDGIITEPNNAGKREVLKK